jgi:hypothetical protein
MFSCGILEFLAREERVGGLCLFVFAPELLFVSKEGYGMGVVWP